MTNAYFRGLATFLLLLTIDCSARAQDVKQGICPPATSSSYRSVNFGQTGFQDDLSPFSAQQHLISAPQYFPVMLNATLIGVGAVGEVPVYKNYILRASILNLSSDGYTSPYYQSVILPVEFGLRIPIINSKLGTLSYTLYAETSAGLLLGWAFPTNGSFLNYTIPNSRFTSGATAYLGLGNSLRFDKYLGLYFNGGMNYFDLFSSSFMPRSRFLVPSVAIGFYFNIAG